MKCPKVEVPLLEDRSDEENVTQGSRLGKIEENFQIALKMSSAFSKGVWKFGAKVIRWTEILTDCVVPEKIPTQPMEGHWKFPGGGGS